MSEGKNKTIRIQAPMQAVVHQVNVAVGDSVAAGQEVAVLEAMKMQHGITAPTSGVVKAISVAVGEVVEQNGAILSLDSGTETVVVESKTDTQDLDYIRPDLAELNARLDRTLDAARPEKWRDGMKKATGRRAKMLMIYVIPIVSSNMVN